MGIKTKKYRALHTTQVAIRNNIVSAIRVTERNMGSVAMWSGAEILASDTRIRNGVPYQHVRLSVPTRKGTKAVKRIAQIGDFVIKVTEEFDGKTRNVFYIGKDDVFEAGFELVKS